MRNTGKSKIGKIIEVAKKLPIFTLDDLASMETDKKYLRILLSRYVKAGKVIRLKKGLYVARDYMDGVEKTGRTRSYAEFLASVLYSPSYLSLEYALYQHNVITESPVTITAISSKKTSSFKTPFGTYQYHSIAPAIFAGFTAKREGDYLVFRASLAKALFDFLYLRKNNLTNEKSVRELRLNLTMLKNSDKKELGRYVHMEGSLRMNNIYKMLWKK